MIKLKRRTLIALAIELLLVVVVLYGVNMWRTRDSATGQAPALVGVSVSGESLDLEALKGQTTLVHFWATWCPICSFEEQNIESVAGDIPTLTVALSSGSDSVIRHYMDEHKLSFVTINDNEGDISQRWGVAGVPMSFIIDKSGEIRFSEVGYTSTLGLRLRIWLAENY